MDKPVLTGEPLVLSPEDNKLKNGQLTIQELYERLKRLETDESKNYSDRLTAGCAGNTLRALADQLAQKNLTIETQKKQILHWRAKSKRN